MLRRSRHLARAIMTAGMVVAATFGTARSARAQALLERFDPAARGSRFFVADSLELEGNARFAAGLVTSYGTNLRTFRQSGGDAERSNLVEHSLWLHPGASLVLSPGARFAIDVPVALQSGNDVSLDRTTYFAPSSPRLGDVKGSFDLRLVGRKRDDVDGAVLAAGVSAYLPTGSFESYTSDDFARVAFRVATAVRVGPVLVAGRVGYTYRTDEATGFSRVSPGSETNLVLGVGYSYGPLVTGPELYGSTILKDAFQRRTTPVEVLYGAHVSIGDIRVGGGLGTALVTGLGAPGFRGVLSIEWAPPATAPADRDRDGVLDADDMCPDVAGIDSGVVGARGCPDAPSDRDHDGIVDVGDACADVPGVKTMDAKTNGCPARAPEETPPTPAPAPLPAPLPAPEG